MRKEYGLIGKSLGHSFSQKYFTEKFQRLGISNSNYQLFSIDTLVNFPNLLKEHPNLNGLNVTIPYKQSIIAYLNGLDPIAESIGAINTIQFNDNQLIGYNTDVVGFEKAFKPLVQPHHSHALILGNGGSSKAVQHVLKSIGISYQVIARQAQPNVLAFSELTDFHYKQFKVIINCTPLGMYPEINEAPLIDYSKIGHLHLLFDLVYNPLETLFIARGKEKNAITSNGLSMLYYQADAAWDLWQ